MKTTMKLFINIYVLLLITLVTFCAGCKKWIDVAPPVTSLTQASTFTTDATAIAAVTGLYAKMMAAGFNPGVMPASLPFYTGISSDELSYESVFPIPENIAFYQNALFVNPTVTYGSEFWTNSYNLIFICNQAIEGLNAANSLTPAVKQQLIGEAKFMRAYFFFYIVNLYGDCPLTLGTDYKTNNSLARSSRNLIYEQIITDLIDAQGLLSSTYLNGGLKPYSSTPDRVRPSKWAAAALLARVYLYQKDFIDAEKQSTMLINNTGLFSLSSLSNAFQRSSLGNNETIWEMQPVNTGWNTEEARGFIMTSDGPGFQPNFGAIISPNLLNGFESGDNRKTTWIGNITASGKIYYFPYKYKSVTANAPVTEFSVVLRLGEQYLIRAEARAQQNNLSGAQSDLNTIRTRAGLPTTTAASQADLIMAILHEREVELFAEGHRWLDLKRTGNVDAAMINAMPQKGSTWNTNQQWYPLPYSDLQNNPNLKQNLGY